MDKQTVQTGIEIETEKFSFWSLLFSLQIIREINYQFFVSRSFFLFFSFCKPNKCKVEQMQT